MNPTKFKKIRKRAISVARSFGIKQEDAEDLASEVVLRRLEGKNLNQAVGYGVIDSIRRLFGDRRNNSYEGKKNIALLQISEEDPSVEDYSDGSEYQSSKDFQAFIKELEPMYRCIFVLISVYGFTEKEVGYCLGVTESRVSNFVKVLLKLANDFMKTSAGE